MHQQYADDTQLYIELASSDPQNAIQKLENCLSKLHLWFCLNPGKSEVVVFGTHQRLRSFPVPSSVNIAGVNAAISPCITTLGVSLDKHLTMDNHVMTVRRGCLFHLRALRHLRPVLPRDIATTIAVALIQTRLDYANAVLIGTSNQNINKLQHIQNSLARVVTSDFSRPAQQLLKELHWLPIDKRIEFKLATLSYTAINQHQPVYLSELLTPAVASRSTRSTGLNLLHVPFSSSNFGSRAFSVAAPKIWNNIPLQIRNSTSLAAFKSHLKTYYFSTL